MGGLCGALYIYVNHTFNYAFRKKYLKTKYSKIAETLMLTLVTVTFFYWAPELMKDNCINISDIEPDTLDEVEDYLIQYKCNSTQYSPLATFVYNQQSTNIRAMFNLSITYLFAVMMIYFWLWFLFTMITSGTAVPAGIFLPCILIGQCLGQLYYITVNYVMGENPHLTP
mmetsp:Transcript_16996/g.12165  ORF Transcript_16996/g.12165 Transcript_16996/m.12165 type:complete len:170 (+) Transcript_16996:857-1366(+)